MTNGTYESLAIYAYNSNDCSCYYQREKIGKDGRNMGTPEKLEQLAQKMRDLETAVEQSKTHLDDDLMVKLQAGINALLLALEKAIDGMISLVGRFLN